MKNAVWNKDEMANIQNKDRILPSQPYFNKMYNGKDYYGDLENLLGSMYKAPQWNIKTKDGLSYSCMGSDLNTLRFYQFLIHSHGYKKVLELGTYIGVSAMYMAAAGAEVVTVEKGKEFFDIARENFDRNGFKNKILAFCSDAVTFESSYQWGEDYYFNPDWYYDLILIDCAKESYKDLLELSLRRLSKNGMILVDDVFFQGETLSGNPTSEKGKGVKAMLEYAKTLDGYEKVILPLGNGLLLVRKS